MQGSYLNPHALQPAEVLTPQLLFNRYLDWKIYWISKKAWAQFEGCSKDLHKGMLCCESHFRLSQEHDDFVRYFCHLGMMTYAEPYFSNAITKNWIRTLGLTYDLDKLATSMDMTPHDCRRFLLT